jgi:hypothetical protein
MQKTSVNTGLSRFQVFKNLGRMRIVTLVTLVTLPKPGRGGRKFEDLGFGVLGSLEFGIFLCLGFGAWTTCREAIVSYWAPESWRTWEVNFHGRLALGAWSFSLEVTLVHACSCFDTIRHASTRF